MIYNKLWFVIQTTVAKINTSIAIFNTITNGTDTSTVTTCKIKIRNVAIGTDEFGQSHVGGTSSEKIKAEEIVTFKAGPISSVYVMQDEVSSLKKENAEQKYVIADQAARLTTLEAENEQQRRELAETKKGLDDLKAAVDKLLASKG